jgi:hypothetical protein
MNRRIVLIIVVLSATLSLFACGVENVQNRPGNGLTSDVDQRFREFYDLLGGVDILGPAISPKFIHGGNEYQYTTAALMVYYPNSVDSQRYQIAPLGGELGIAEPPLNPDAPNGHEIYQGFVDLYNKLGGVRFVGLPITDVRYNTERGRVEQYFENLGFYQLESSPANEVRLLHYGAWKCAVACGYSSPKESQILQKQSVGSPFSGAIQRLDPSFTGFPLTEPYTSFDGLLEQIFENVVVVADPNNPAGIRLRPILGMLGIPTDANTNFAIPGDFLEYLNRNTGLEFSGKPISEYAPLSQDVNRQCFTNLCLDYYPNSPDGMRVRPVPLGYTYKNLYYESGAGGDVSSSNRAVTLRVWERYPLIANHQVQEIGISLSSGNRPVENVQAVLTLSVPGSEDISYMFPPTRNDGTAYLELSPISAPNGTRIEYQACVTNVNETFCVQDDFMIWGSQ